MAASAARVLSLIAVLGIAGPLSASEPPGPEGALDRAAVERFVDEHFETTLAATGVAGAMVAIVQGQETLLLRGYGTRDVETGAPVDPERTLYRLGSITKPMTAIAALQLVERGLLDLDADVNTYLRRVQVPDSYVEPITLRQLLTHRGGLDADMSFSNVGPPGTPPDVPADLLGRRLYRARPPGGVAAYDVLGFGLVSVLLQDVTGAGFDRVIHEAVFEPAGMNHAVIGLPLDRLGDIARCHNSTQPGDARTCAHEVLAELYQGSGDAAATASDMAAFMKMLLRGAQGEGDGPLSADGFSQMLDFDQYRFHPSSRGLGLGMQELEYAGRRGFGHGGGIQGFQNQMDLFPRHGVGIYFGVNGEAEQVYDARLSMLPRLIPAPVPPDVQEASARLWDFTSLFAEEFLPQDAPPDREASTSPPDSPGQFAGFYLHNRFVSDNILINLSRLGLAAEITVAGNGILVDGNGPYEPVGAGLFENENGRTVAFRGGEHGTWASFRGEPFATYQRVCRLAHPVFSVMPLLPSLVLLLSSLIYLLPRFAGGRRRAAMLWGIGGGLFLLGFVLELEYGVLLREIRGHRLLPALWRVGLWLAAIALALAPVAAPAWRWAARSRPLIRWTQRAHGTLTALAGLYIVAFALYWGFLF